jgi:hypothetical protein
VLCYSIAQGEFGFEGHPSRTVVIPSTPVDVCRKIAGEKAIFRHLSLNGTQDHRIR